MNKNLLEALKEKLHPQRFTAMSPKMAWIISCILGTDWATGPRGEPPTQSFSITSDGFVTSASIFIGDKDEFRMNIHNLLNAADLNPKERAAFRKLYAAKVQDWSTGFPGKGDL
jgi:hypothetical protein